MPGRTKVLRYTTAKTALANGEKHMRKQSYWALAAGAMAIAGWFGQGSISHAQGAGPGAAANRFELADVQGPLTTTYVPRGLDQDTLVTVVATLAGDPVAIQQETAGRRFTRPEKDRVKAQRLAEQTAVRPSIEALGGQVVGAYQSALNGVKVRIPRSQIAALRQVNGVVDVKTVNVYQRENAFGVPRIQAPTAWAGVAGFRGEGIKVGIIDSGIDYTHANFGGPGTAAAYAAARATGTQAADPALFGPGAPKVKGGIDLAGDDYDASVDTSVPQPDPNPLDCDVNGHGSHVAGTAAGFGVRGDGTTYAGPYDLTTHSNAFRVGPGVAPRADLYAIRVFGCDGSTNLVTEALEWAVDNDMDVVNMSLGSSFGSADDASALASDNAVKAGIVVVASAGNSGDLRYITGAPGASTRTISVGAAASRSFLPGATVPAGGATRLVLNANDAPLSGPTTYGVFVLRVGGIAAGAVSLGCKPPLGPDDWSQPGNAGAVGKLVIVRRGSCARVAKAVYGQQAGAAAVLMVNNANVLPPFEGPITLNPDDNTPYVVTIPFFGARSGDGTALRSLAGPPGTGTFTPATIPTGLADFSSGGPRNGDGVLKPDVTAPGLAIVSTLVASGNEGVAFSGTSMASPHVAGAAALVVQAHPRWRPWAVKAALINSGRPAELADYRTHTAGSGVVSAASAALTSVYAYADRQTTTLNFGVEQFRRDFTRSQPIHLRNDSKSDVVFDVAVTVPQGSPHTVALDRTQVWVPARGDAQVEVTLTIPAATAGNSDAFRDVAGLVTFTPQPGMNGGYALRVPYYVVPRVSSNVSARLERDMTAGAPAGAVLLDNHDSPIAATADFYAWGLESRKAPKIGGPIDLRSAGVQSFFFSPSLGQLVVFAINTNKGWSSASTQEFDVLVDASGDGVADYAVVGVDLGLITTGAFDGRIASAIFNLNTGGAAIYFLASASTDGSSILLPVPAFAIGLSPANPRFVYTAASFDLFSPDSDQFESAAGFNAFSSAITNGDFVGLNPDDQVSVPFAVNAAEWAITPALGIMVVTPDNKNGAGEANLLKVKVKP